MAPPVTFLFPIVEIFSPGIQFIVQSMPLIFPVLSISQLPDCRNRNDLFWKPWLYSHDLICKLLNVFHPDGVERSQNYITMVSALAPQFSHHDLESIIISPLLVSFVSLLHKYLTIVPRAQGGRGKSSQREWGYSKCRDTGFIVFPLKRDADHL